MRRELGIGGREEEGGGSQEGKHKRRAARGKEGEGKEGRRAGFSQWRPPVRARRLRGEMEITNWGSEGGTEGRDGRRGDDDFGCKRNM